MQGYNLPVDIGGHNTVTVYQMQFANATTGECLNNIATDSSYTNHSHFAGHERLKSRLTQKHSRALEFFLYNHIAIDDE